MSMPCHVTPRVQRVAVQQALCPAVDGRLVGDRDAEQPVVDEQREAVGELRDEVGLAAVSEAVDQLVDHRLNSRLGVPPDGVASQRRRHDRAVDPVFATGHALDRVAPHRLRRDRVGGRRRKRLLVAEPGGHELLGQQKYGPRSRERHDRVVTPGPKLCQHLVDVGLIVQYEVRTVDVQRRQRRGGHR